MLPGRDAAHVVSCSGTSAKVRATFTDALEERLGEAEDETAGGSNRLTCEGGMRVRSGVHCIPGGTGDGGVKAVGMEPTLENRFSMTGSPMTATWAERAVFPTKARPGRSSGWAASRKASRRSARSLQSLVRSPETAPDKSSEDEARATVHRDRSRTSIKSDRGRAEGRARRPGAGSDGRSAQPRAWNCRRSFGDSRKSRSLPDAGEGGDHRPPRRSCAGRRSCAAHCRMLS